MPAPKDLTVATVSSSEWGTDMATDEITFNELGGTFKYHRKRNLPQADASMTRWWVNEGNKVKPAPPLEGEQASIPSASQQTGPTQSNPTPQGNGRDATGRSIERQTAAKAAAEMVAAVGAGNADFMVQNFDAAFDMVLRKITGGKGDDDIPF